MGTPFLEVSVESEARVPKKVVNQLSPCETQCRIEQQDLIACVRSSQSVASGEGLITKCDIATAVAVWTACCSKANEATGTDRTNDGPYFSLEAPGTGQS
mmetsp:Transcript_28545/g.57052  ORF Transcript_28545/g.57052 Transcript_28545/m.57052 type:complete len:100 (+) Transcript_28545:74-373(+)